MSASHTRAYKKYAKTEKGKKSINAKNRAYRERRAVAINALKGDVCSSCGEFYPPYILDFHHRDPKTKLFTIARGRQNVSFEKILAEIEKCDVLCANCHRMAEHAHTR